MSPVALQRLQRAERVAERIAGDDRWIRRAIEPDRDDRVRVGRDVGACRAAKHASNARQPSHHSNRSASSVARFTYACAAASAGSRSTTGWPAANASVDAIVRGITTSNTMFAGRCERTYCATRSTRRVLSLVHRQQDAVERELVVRRDDVLNAAQNLRRRLQRERLALQRHDHVLTRLEHLVHDRAESGRRVDDDDVTPLARRVQQLLQEIGLGDERVIRPVVGGVAHRAGEHHAKPRQRRRQDDLAQPARAVQVVGESVRRMAPLEPHAVAHRALRVDVDDSVFSPRRANAAARLTEVVVLPTPPF